MSYTQAARRLRRDDGVRDARLSRAPFDPGRRRPGSRRPLSRREGSAMSLIDRHHDGRRGPSSLWLHDPETVFRALDLRPGEAFLDLGCGPGDWALEASGRVGPAGTVCALDTSAVMVQRLWETAAARGLAHLEASVADITGRLPLGDGVIDCCLLATVLHIFGQSGLQRVAFDEIRRVLKPEGRLAVIELKREDRPSGRGKIRSCDCGFCRRRSRSPRIAFTRKDGFWDLAVASPVALGVCRRKRVLRPPHIDPPGKEEAYEHEGRTGRKSRRL